MPDLCEEISCENISGVRWLLEHGESANFFKDGTPSLIWAIGSGGNREIVDLLLLHNADVNRPNDSGITPIMTAIEMGYCDLVEVFIRHHADVDAVDNDGCTALFWATSEACIEPLIRAGANLDHHNTVGETALDKAFNRKQFVQAVFLLEAGARIGETLVSKGQTSAAAFKWLTEDAYVLYATIKDNCQLLEKKLATGISPEVRREDTSETLLMMAAFYGFTDAIELLLRYGANLNTTTHKSGRTALMTAISTSKVDVVSQLLQHGADQTIIAMSGKTALTLAAAKGNKDIVFLLLRNASDNAIKLNIIPAIEAAKKAGHSDVASLLVTAHILP